MYVKYHGKELCLDLTDFRLKLDEKKCMHQNKIKN